MKPCFCMAKSANILRAWDGILAGEPGSSNQNWMQRKYSGGRDMVVLDAALSRLILEASFHSAIRGMSGLREGSKPAPAGSKE